MLFIYLDDRCFVLLFKRSSSISFLIVAIVAAYLSVVITLGLELCGDRRALRKNFFAAFLSRFLDNQKSIVLPF